MSYANYQPSTKKRENAVGGGGIGIVGLLAVAFIVLKLAGIIAWPWVWVLAPLWGSAVLAVIMVVVFIILVTSVIREEGRRG